MLVTELDTFVRKFHQLWKAGLTAHLDLDTNAGNAWVGLRVHLGHHVPGPLHHQVFPSSSRKRNSPARQRRRARRAAARNASTEETKKKTETVEESDLNNEIAEQVTAKATETSDKLAETARDLIAEKAKPDFPCVICDFVSNWEGGLHIHISRKHSTIEQVDGNNSLVGDDPEEDLKYDISSHYWKTGKLGTGYQAFLDANEIINASSLDEESKSDEKDKVLEARKCAFGERFIHMPPWNQRIPK